MNWLTSFSAPSDMPTPSDGWEDLRGSMSVLQAEETDGPMRLSLDVNENSKLCEITFEDEAVGRGSTVWTSRLPKQEEKDGKCCQLLPWTAVCYVEVISEVSARSKSQ
ncbi:hypothetical protein NliqN6_6168 [Naganishia liquefaciens]|uniref:Uncharacterized protein n=1 Tax=Naganishia liquefaciens TaxID=104408 RepID=A0A8H3TZJ6_9TREE|nr:hypothetical protein NliqN6_6168 [Naganishia liquefaciens]